MDRLLESIAVFNQTFRLEFPFWGYLLAQLPRRVDPEVLDLQLDLRDSETSYLLIGPGFQQLNYQERSFWVRFALVHLVLEHPWQLSTREEKASVHLAMDLAAYHYLREKQEASFFEDCYRSLATPSEPEDWNQWLAVFDSEKLLQNYEPYRQRHQFWRRAHNLEPETQRLQLQAMVRDSLGHAGGTNALDPFVEKLLRKKYSTYKGLNWRSVLQFYVHTNSSTRIDHTLKRPSKRYGTRPGIRIRSRLQLIVILDTSASVSVELLQLFFEEIDRLHGNCQDLQLIEADTQVQRTYRYRGTIPETITGRGNTLYDPAITYAEAAFPQGVLLYFTDGQGPAPMIRYTRPLLWCLAGSEDGSHLPGQKVYLNPKLQLI